MKKSSTTSNTNTDKTKLEEFNEGVRDLKAQWLTKLDAVNAEKFYKTFVEEYNDYLPFHTAYLQVIDPLDKRVLPLSKNTHNKNDLTKVITIANEVIDKIDQESLLSYIATKTDLRSDAAKIKR